MMGVEELGGCEMEIGLVRQVDIDREMQQAYLDYAMSVIVAPDFICDG